MIGRRPNGPERRARRLLCWYPRSWRDRYGEEFKALLIDEIAERPRSWRRAVDVASNGLIARLTDAGLTEHCPLPSVAGSGASLASLLGAAIAFMAFGLTIWSQTMVGWAWSQPGRAATMVAVLAMYLAALLIASLAAVAAAPLLWALAHAARQPTRWRLLRPVLLAGACAAVLIVGAHHFQAGWPGTGGHPWSWRGILPSGIAAFCWALTLSVTSYWGHPGALLSFPRDEVAWMAVSPWATIGLIVGLVKTLRRLPLTGTIRAVEAQVAKATPIVMLLFLSSAACWVVAGSGPRNLVHVGTIDIASLALMGVAAVIATRAATHVRGAGATT
jgi:hypothetical protein